VFVCMCMCVCVCVCTIAPSTFEHPVYSERPKFSSLWWIIGLFLRVNTKLLYVRCICMHLHHIYSTSTAHLQHIYSTSTAHLQPFSFLHLSIFCVQISLFCVYIGLFCVWKGMLCVCGVRTYMHICSHCRAKLLLLCHMSMRFLYVGFFCA